MLWSEKYGNTEFNTQMQGVTEGHLPMRDYSIVRPTVSSVKTERHETKMVDFRPNHSDLPQQ